MRVYISNLGYGWIVRRGKDGAWIQIAGFTRYFPRGYYAIAPERR